MHFGKAYICGPEYGGGTVAGRTQPDLRTRDDDG